MSNKILTRSAELIYGIATLIFFIMMIMIFVKLNGSDYGYLGGMGKSWNSGPITSVNTNGGVICQAGEESLLTDVWPGTRDGCFCSPNLDILYGPLRTGSCRRKRDSFIFCSTVSAKEPMPYNVWRGKSICVKRDQSNYFDLKIATDPKSCPMNTKSCGIIDTSKNVLCVESNQTCPINYIKFIKSNDVTPTDMKYSVIEANGAKILFSNENNQGRILNELEISEDQPCANPEYKNNISTPYLLDPYISKNKCDDMIGTYKYDDSYIKLDTYSSYNLYSENNILQILLNLPEYPNPQTNQFNYNLYYRNYVGMKPSCIERVKQNGNPQDLITDLVQINDNMIYALGFSIANMILSIILFIIVLVYLIIVVFLNQYEEKDISEKLCYIAVPYFLTVLMVAFGFVISSYLKSYSSNEVLADEECLDPMSYAATSNFYDSISSAKSLNQLCLVSGGFMIVVPILEILLNAFVL